jgi:hypothetical protein
MRITEIPSPDPDDLSLEFLVGRRMTVIDASAAPNGWVFRFDGSGTLGVECLWRLVSDERIVVTSEDHQQRFGLPAPIDASARALQAIDAKPIRRARFDTTTGDLTIEFANGVRLEAIVTSGGYENWAFSKPDGTQLIALGGGRVAFFRTSTAG